MVLMAMESTENMAMANMESIMGVTESMENIRGGVTKNPELPLLGGYSKKSKRWGR